MKELVGLTPVSSAVAKRKHADINIFTVASGLLYEVSLTLRMLLGKTQLIFSDSPQS